MWYACETVPKWIGMFAGIGLVVDITLDHIKSLNTLAINKKHRTKQKGAESIL